MGGMLRVHRYTHRCTHRLPSSLTREASTNTLKEEEIMALTRRQFLRNASLGIGAVVGGSLLAACGSPQATAPEASGQTGQETVQLRYAHWGTEDEKASTKATLDAFMKANPNIVVE